MKGQAVLLLLLFSTPGTGAEDLLRAGNEAYRAGKFDKAIQLYRRPEQEATLLTRKFNAGCAFLRKGDLEEASKRFEEVSARAEGTLRNAALYNVGYVNFQKGRGQAKEAAALGDPQEIEKIDQKIKVLLQACASYRNALDFYRRIQPPTGEAERAVKVTKVALIAALDEVARLEERKKEKHKEELCKNPPALLREVIRREKLHRALSRTLKHQEARVRRLASRRLRKAEGENRALAESLLNYLKHPPEKKPPQGAAPPKQPQGGQSSLQDMRRKEAISALQEACEAQRQAEAAYLRRAPGEATAHHTTALVAFRKVRTFFPLNLPELLAEGIRTQQAVLQGTKALGAAASGEKKAAEGTGSLLLQVLKDGLLAPVARLLSPQAREQLQALREEEEEVVWLGTVLSTAQAGQAGVSQPGTPAVPQARKTDPEKVRKLFEQVRREGATCREAAQKACDFLQKAITSQAVLHQEKALAALKRLRDLLPKPPQTPEERLRELIERQRAALKTTQGMEKLAPPAKKAASEKLTQKQREDGREASEIASLLRQRKDGKAQQAAEKVKVGEERIYASAESLQRVKLLPAETSVKEAVTALQEALALLAGGKGQQAPKRQPAGKQKQKEKGNRGEKGKKKQKTNYSLTPRLARLRREEMDRLRREKEAQLLVSPSSVAVDKDW